MNTYEIIKKTLKHEGGYSSNKADKGGETYCGISRVYNPTWKGWLLLDKQKDKKQAFNNGFLLDEVMSFYYEKYFKQMQLDLIQNSNLKACIFDFCVNSGGAVRVIQNMLNTKYRSGLIVDNRFGNNIAFTLNRIQDQIKLNNDIVEARKTYIETLIKNGDVSPIFLTGLLNRAESYRLTPISSFFDEIINFLKRLFA